MEVWRTVVEAPTYEVSNLGRVRNRRTGRILRTSKSKERQEKVNLRDAGFTITRSVHKIRKDAFE